MISKRRASNLEWQKFGINRRRFLQAASAMGMAAAGSAMVPRIGEAEGERVLRVRSVADIRSFDPAFGGTETDSNVYDCVFEKLIVYEPGTTWSWRRENAQNIEQLDARHIRFELRPNTMFTNDFGEMTAEDVKYSFERVIDPELDAAMKGDWELLDHVEVKDRYTGIIVLKDDFQPVWLTTLPYISGNILSKKAMESIGGRIEGLPPCYVGPYVVQRWEPRQQAVLVRNELWNGPRPYFDEIRIIPIDDEQTAERGFEAGNLDFTRVSLASLDTYEANPPPNAIIEKRPSLYYTWLGMNMDHPKLADSRVRRAIQMAIDVPSIIDVAYFGLVEPATGIIPSGLLGHREETLMPLEANADEARELLAEAGHGSGLELTLDVINTSTHLTAAQIIQANLQAIGVQATINTHETGSFWTLGDESQGDRWQDIQLILNRYSSTPDPYWYTAWFTCEQVGVWNWERYCSEEFDEMHVAAISEGDVERRDEMYRNMQDLMERSGAYRFITNEANPVIYRNNIRPALRPDGNPLLRYFEGIS